ILFLSLWSAPSVYGSTITVNSTDWDQDDDGNCTLPEALLAANDNTPSGATLGECAAGDDNDDTIVFSITGTLNMQSAAPPITHEVHILGPGSDQLIIDRVGAVGSFSDFSTSGSDDFTLRVSALTFAHADNTGATGGVFRIIGDDHDLVIEDCVFLNNTAGSAGAINTPASLTILRSSFIGNT